MKRILLIITLALCIFQMVVLATAIDIGSAAIDRALATSTNRRTYVDRNNPANETGTITSVEIWAVTNMSDVEVATFFVVSGDNLSTRGTHAIGSVTSGSKQTFSGLSIEVTSGDLIGITYSAGSVEKDEAGTGYYYISSDQIPCTDVTFSNSNTRSISVYGIGTTEEEEEEDNAIFFGFNL